MSAQYVDCGCPCDCGNRLTIVDRGTICRQCVLGGHNPAKATPTFVQMTLDEAVSISEADPNELAELELRWLHGDR